MESVYFILYPAILIMGFLLGYLVVSYQQRCKHTWVLTEEGNIRKWRGSKKYHVGYFKVYECTECKEMKTVKSLPVE